MSVQPWVILLQLQAQSRVKLAQPNPSCSPGGTVRWKGGENSMSTGMPRTCHTTQTVKQETGRRMMLQSFAKQSAQFDFCARKIAVTPGSHTKCGVVWTPDLSSMFKYHVSYLANVHTYVILTVHCTLRNTGLPLADHGSSPL